MTELRVVDPPSGSWWDTEPGDMWPCLNAGESHTVDGRGPCWVIRLPGQAYVWHTNMPSSDGGMWDVTGAPPNITVQPSINVGPEIWHGWIRDGRLVDA